MCFLLWNTQPLKNGSLLLQVTLLSLVPSKELACVRLLRKCESQTPPTLLCCGYLGLAVSQGDFFTGLSALPESSLKSSPKSKGQVARWSDALPRKAKSQWSSAQPCQGLPFSPAELRGERGSQPRLPPHRSFPVFSLFPPHGFLNPWKAERIFPTLKESTRHVIALEAGTSMPSPTHPVGQRGPGIKWKDVLETTSRNLSVHISLKTSSLD